MTSPSPRSPRADARRNRDALVAAGEALFARHGANLPFEDVAREAGVGKGTLYRHFATRDHLVVAILQDRFDRLTDEAVELLDSESPSAAVATWLRDFDRYPPRARALGIRVGEGLADEGSAVAAACRPMKRSFGRLLERAQAAGEIRSDVDVAELLTVVATLPQQFRDANGSSAFLEVIIRGLRAETGLPGSG